MTSLLKTVLPLLAAAIALPAQTLTTLVARFLSDAGDLASCLGCVTNPH
jgi:hypothetical protein